ncbi:DNA-processing protein DprA [Myxococcus stipitatus]|uniref:DNA-processing protein DprA n=1 Tax=Myxococcus stipitatus TaxID=83455 RepID=UPI0030CEDF4E
MADAETDSLTAEQQACLALWTVPGLGPRTLAALRVYADEHLSSLASTPVRDWVSEAPVSPQIRRRLLSVERLAPLAEQVMEACHAGEMSVAFAGQPAFPERLREVVDAPPLLFHRGRPGTPRRRVAMVGSRRPDQGFLPFARAFARQVAEGGVGVVSGAAVGVDRACHWGALDAGGETWAFLGSALDVLDPAQAGLLPHFLEGGGVFFSELPPGVRASTTTFPRRNRLISGASDAVLVLRAGAESGSLYTARAGRAQGRTVLAMPGDVRQDGAAGCNALLREGHASACLDVKDVWRAVGVDPGWMVAPEVGDARAGLSAEARGAYAVLDRIPRTFDEVLAGSTLTPAALVGALVELEMTGLVIQHPGRLYEKI